MKKLVLAALFVMGAVAMATSTANATVLGQQEQKQSGEQKTEWKCNPKQTTTYGSYGTSTTVTEGNCEGSVYQKLEQEQKQQILGEQVVVKDERVHKIHYPVGTAMDTRTLITALGITAIGGVALVARKKIV